MSNQHEEFPELADESKAALKAAHETHIVNVLYDNVHARRYCAALLREAMKQTRCATSPGGWPAKWGQLEAIATNLHSPPPPPPTLAQAQEANLLSPEGRDVVCAFLMSLGGES